MKPLIPTLLTGTVLLAGAGTALSAESTKYDAGVSEAVSTRWGDNRSAKAFVRNDDEGGDFAVALRRDQCPPCAMRG